MNSLSEEVFIKLQLIRQTLSETDAKGVYLRGTDWFAWATAGGSNTVLLTAETGIAEVLVTADDAWILTDEIEAQRLKDEELPANFQLYINPWADTAARDRFIREATGGGKILCDTILLRRPSTLLASPEGYEDGSPWHRVTTSQEYCLTNSTAQPLPSSLVNHKRTIMSSEVERYREVGRKASIAMTSVLKVAKPTWTEYQLAGAGAEALWSQGLHPALTLVAGERRLPLYRHATATAEPIGRQAMMVFCARGYGLYANLTRFVSFGAISSENAELHRHVREIETVALEYCKPGVALHEVYQALAGAYQQHGFANAIKEHHQGGTTGYLAREIVANPATNDTLTQNMAVAWNPSLPGAKIEDTFVILDGKLENLTFDANFPNIEVEGRLRPVPLEN